MSKPRSTVLLPARSASALSPTPDGRRGAAGTGWPPRRPGCQLRVPPLLADLGALHQTSQQLGVVPQVVHRAPTGVHPDVGDDAGGTGSAECLGLDRHLVGVRRVVVRAGRARMVVETERVGRGD